MVQPLGIGLIGLGRLAQLTHLPSVLSHPAVRLTGLCDIQPGRAAEVAASHGLTVTIETDYQRLLAEPAVEAVIISVPNAWHAPVTLAALAAGKHVLCEKPPALNAAEAGQMLATARANQCLLVYGFNNRYRDDVRHLQRLIEDGTLGDIYYAKAASLRWRGAPQGWFTEQRLAGGGALIDIGVHMLDLALYLMGYPRATRVSAATYNVFGARVPLGVRPWQAADVYTGVAAPPIFDVEDLATALIRFENGAVLQLESAWALHLGNERAGSDVCLYGTRGGAELRPQLRIHTELADQLVEIEPVVSGDGRREYNREFSAFVAAIQRGDTTTTAAEQGYWLMQIIDALYASAAAGAEVAIA